jgi:hypothetical protein
MINSDSTANQTRSANTTPSKRADQNDGVEKPDIDVM